jgi:hypothetical protein
VAGRALGRSAALRRRRQSDARAVAGVSWRESLLGRCVEESDRGSGSGSPGFVRCSARGERDGEGQRSCSSRPNPSRSEAPSADGAVAGSTSSTAIVR